MMAARWRWGEAQVDRVGRRDAETRLLAAEHELPARAEQLIGGELLEVPVIVAGQRVESHGPGPGAADNLPVLPDKVLVRSHDRRAFNPEALDVERLSPGRKRHQVGKRGFRRIRHHRNGEQLSKRSVADASGRRHSRHFLPPRS